MDGYKINNDWIDSATVSFETHVIVEVWKRSLNNEYTELDELHESDRYLHYNMEWEINMNTLVTVTVHDAVLYLPL